jgi:hypothetical protein
LAIAKLGSRVAASETRARMMQLRGAQAAARGAALAATSSRDEVSLQVARCTQKACGSNSLSRFLKCLLRKSFQVQPGRPEDHLTVT